MMSKQNEPIDNILDLLNYLEGVERRTHKWLFGGPERLLRTMQEKVDVAMKVGELKMLHKIMCRVSGLSYVEFKKWQKSLDVTSGDASNGKR